MVVKIWRDLRVHLVGLLNQLFDLLSGSEKCNYLIRLTGFVQSAQRHWYRWIPWTSSINLDELRQGSWCCFIIWRHPFHYGVPTGQVPRRSLYHVLINYKPFMSALPCELWLCHCFIYPCQGFAAAARSQGKHKQRIWLKISSSGLKIMDERSGVSHLTRHFSLFLLIVLYCSISTLPRLDVILKPVQSGEQNESTEPV